MKVLIAGGGTGGHVYPGIAIANEIRHRHPDWEIEFVGRHDSIEGRVVPEAGYEIHHLYVSAYERYYSRLEKAQVIGRLLISIKDSFKLMRKIDPDIVVGTGGYICGPIVLTAALKKLPSLISEQNVIPGFTIKTLSRFADTVCTSFKDTAQYMHHPERCVLTGNPVRREFGLFTKEIARKSLKIGPEVKMILSFGGSAGAKTINDSIARLILHYKNDPNVFIYHVTGYDSHQDVIDFLKSNEYDPAQHKNAKVVSYTGEMPMLLNAADLVISRSGAMTISEINYVGAAALYSPYPHAANDHQTKNALVTQNNGASVIIKDSEMTGENLIKTVTEILNNDKLLKEMALKSKELGIRNSAELLCDEIEKLAKKAVKSM